VLMAIVKGVSEGRHVEWRVRAVVPASASLGAAAGEIDTGIPPTVVARALGRGEIDKPGVWAPEQVVDVHAFFAELRGWGIVAEATRREILGGDGVPVDWSLSASVE
jgi:saccharopine dehydrogenase-like NADP-dependent oxidoreductase